MDRGWGYRRWGGGNMDRGWGYRLWGGREEKSTELHLLKDFTLKTAYKSASYGLKYTISVKINLRHLITSSS